jgi:hypothetical protein
VSNTNPLLRPAATPEAPPSRNRAFGPGKTQILYLPNLTKAEGVQAESATPPASPSSTLPLSAPPPVPAEQLYTAPNSPSSTLPLSAPPPAAAPVHTMMFGSVLPAPPRSGAAITRFLPVEQLLSRAVEARTASAVAAQLPALPAAAASFQHFPEIAPPSGADIPLRVGPLGQVVRRFRALSAVSRLSVAMLVLLAVVFAAGRVVKRAAAAEPAGRAPAAVRVPVPSTAAAQPVRPGVAPRVAPAEPLASGLERRAADALAEGRDDAALALYRDLAARAPEQPAFREAVRLLERRKRDTAE